MQLAGGAVEHEVVGQPGLGRALEAGLGQHGAAQPRGQVADPGVRPEVERRAVGAVPVPVDVEPRSVGTLEVTGLGGVDADIGVESGRPVGDGQLETGARVDVGGALGAVMEAEDRTIGSALVVEERLGVEVQRRPGLERVERRLVVGAVRADRVGPDGRVARPGHARRQLVGPRAVLDVVPGEAAVPGVHQRHLVEVHQRVERPDGGDLTVGQRRAVPAPGLGEPLAVAVHPRLRALVVGPLGGVVGVQRTGLAVDHERRLVEGHRTLEGRADGDLVAEVVADRAGGLGHVQVPAVGQGLEAAVGRGGVPGAVDVGQVRAREVHVGGSVGHGLDLGLEVVHPGLGRRQLGRRAARIGDPAVLVDGGLEPLLELGALGLDVQGAVVEGDADPGPLLEPDHRPVGLAQAVGVVGGVDVDRPVGVESVERGQRSQASGAEVLVRSRRRVIQWWDGVGQGAERSRVRVVQQPGPVGAAHRDQPLEGHP